MSPVEIYIAVFILGVLVIAFLIFFWKSIHNQKVSTKLEKSKKSSIADEIAMSGVDINLIKDLFSVMSNVPERSESAVKTYIGTMRERAKMRGYLRYAELLEKHAGTIARLLLNVEQSQKTLIEIQKRMIEANLVPQIHEEWLKQQLAKAQKGENPYASPSPPEEPKNQPEPPPNSIFLGKKPHG
jgi:hypothetical protein